MERRHERAGDHGAGSSFEGLAGRMSGQVMARMNRDMELAAIAELHPAPGHQVLAIGFGAGVGVEALAHELDTGVVTGIDPSSTMVALARHRNRHGIDDGRVVLHRAAAEAIPFSADSFDGVIAVNCIQLWDPLVRAVDEIARVIRRGARLATVTHGWAIENRNPLAEWTEAFSDLLAAHNFTAITWELRKFRSGSGLALSATACDG
jgi:ubiquinone/menaquinone biosynthesis C-methylase UbiE